METQTENAANQSRPARTGNRGGRPLKPDAERRGRHLAVYLLPEEWALIEAAAAIGHARSLSDFGRRAMLAAAGAEEAGPRQAGPQLDVSAIAAQLAWQGSNLNQLVRLAHIHGLDEVAAQAIEAMKAIGDYTRALALAFDPEG